MNTIKVTINNGDCTIIELYDRIALTQGLDPRDDRISYNCSKIDVSQTIMDEVFECYKRDGVDEQTIAMWWVCYGPKANESLSEHEILISEGWCNIA